MENTSIESISIHHCVRRKEERLKAINILQEGDSIAAKIFLTCTDCTPDRENLSEHTRIQFFGRKYLVVEKPGPRQSELCAQKKNLSRLNCSSGMRKHVAFPISTMFTERGYHLIF